MSSMQIRLLGSTDSSEKRAWGGTVLEPESMAASRRLRVWKGSPVGPEARPQGSARCECSSTASRSKTWHSLERFQSSGDSAPTGSARECRVRRDARTARRLTDRRLWQRRVHHCSNLRGHECEQPSHCCSRKTHGCRQRELFRVHCQVLRRR